MNSALEPKSPADSESVLSEMVMPADSNNHGTAFGGFILSMVDKAAAVAAYRHARRPCVTVSIDTVVFKEPIQLGDLITLRARVEHVGTTSMQVGVEITAENLRTGESRLTNVCHLTFVALGENGRPTAVPPLRLDTEHDHIAFEAAQRRREFRLQEERRRAEG